VLTNTPRPQQGVGPYTTAIKTAQEDIDKIIKRVNELTGIKESDTGLGPPSQWDLAGDKQMMAEHPLQVRARARAREPRSSR